jgi:aspartyl-tRNA(Asn)/glutamyl-tRNA(Gln) amidotransferase subunit B
MRKGSDTFGTRAELKNINSFRFVKLAIEHEIARQVELIESGGTVVQETRLWDAERHETRSMRSKEEAHDYRYFPEPDLPPLHVSAQTLAEARASLPELPRAKLSRFQAQYGLPAYDAKLLTAERALADYVEQVVPPAKDPKKVANWLLGELQRLLKEEGVALGALRFTPAQLGALLGLVEAGTVSGSAAKGVLAEMFRSGEDPKAIVDRQGLGQVSDEAEISRVVDEVLAKNASEIAAYRAGKKQVLGFFVGQVMKAMKGKGNPKQVNALLLRKLDG